MSHDEVAHQQANHSKCEHEGGPVAVVTPNSVDQRPRTHADGGGKKRDFDGGRPEKADAHDRHQTKSEAGEDAVNRARRARKRADAIHIPGDSLGHSWMVPYRGSPVNPFRKAFRPVPAAESS